jgi:TetR/AcrR family transcriptional regulator, mexJK operon transcriptional repressor
MGRRAETGPITRPAVVPESADVLIVRVAGTPERLAGQAVGGGPGGKRAAIVRAATELFLRQGYQATRTEQIAAAAAVSKQTVYNQFGDKETLFRDIVLGVTATAETFAAELTDALATLHDPADLEPTLRSLARRYLAAVTNPQVLALRRLVISEALRLPALAAAYYERAPARILTALAEQLGRLADLGLLSAGDPRLAAEDFAFLLVGRHLDEGMFHIPEQASTADGIAHAADHAVDVFLAAYGSASR